MDAPLPATCVVIAVMFGLAAILRGMAALDSDNTAWDGWVWFCLTFAFLIASIWLS